MHTLSTYFIFLANPLACILKYPHCHFHFDEQPCSNSNAHTRTNAPTSEAFFCHVLEFQTKTRQRQLLAEECTVVNEARRLAGSSTASLVKDHGRSKTVISPARDSSSEDDRRHTYSFPDTRPPPLGLVVFGSLVSSLSHPSRWEHPSSPLPHASCGNILIPIPRLLPVVRRPRHDPAVQVLT